MPQINMADRAKRVFLVAFARYLCARRTWNSSCFMSWIGRTRYTVAYSIYILRGGILMLDIKYSISIAQDILACRARFPCPCMAASNRWLISELVDFMVVHSYIWCCLRHTRASRWSSLVATAVGALLSYTFFFSTETVECGIQPGDDVCGMFQVKHWKWEGKKPLRYTLAVDVVPNAGYGCALRTAFACKAIIFIYVFLQCGTRRCHSTDMKIELCFWFRVCVDAISANRRRNDHTPNKHSDMTFGMTKTTNKNRKENHLKMNACNGQRANHSFIRQ